MDGEPENILDTSSQAALAGWDQLLEIQVELFLPYEINYFLTNKSWKNAQHILDAGCGNGYYLSRLKSFFPKKTYTGIDLSAAMTRIAKTRYSHNGIQFEQADFLRFQPQKPFDLIIMRLIVQHMSGFKQILQHASTLLSPNGCLIIIEPDIEGFLNIPDTPLFTRLLSEYGEYTKKTQKNRALLPRLTQLAQEVPDWKVAHQKLVAVPTIGPLSGTKFLQMFHLWIDIFERANVLDFPFADTRQELDLWSSNANVYSQLGVRVIELNCPNSN